MYRDTYDYNYFRKLGWRYLLLGAVVVITYMSGGDYYAAGIMT